MKHPLARREENITSFPPDGDDLPVSEAPIVQFAQIGQNRPFRFVFVAELDETFVKGNRARRRRHSSRDNRWAANVAGPSQKELRRLESWVELHLW
jgi:hypothetical protein